MITYFYDLKEDDKSCPFCNKRMITIKTHPIESHCNGADAPCSTLRWVWAVCDYCAATSPRKTIDNVYDSEVIAAGRESWNMRKEG